MERRAYGFPHAPAVGLPPMGHSPNQRGIAHRRGAFVLYWRSVSAPRSTAPLRDPTPMRRPVIPPALKEIAKVSEPDAAETTSAAEQSPPPIVLVDDMEDDTFFAERLLQD